MLGPHLMSGLLAPVLRTGDAEVVWMSSGGMYGARLVSTPDAIESRTGAYQGVQAYARTKRMQVVLASQWAEALAGTGIRVVSMHPGWAATDSVTEHLPQFDRVMHRLFRDVEGGADTAVWLVATRPPSTAPHFWHDRRQRPGSLPWQRDPARADVDAFVAYVEAATGVRVGASVGS